MNLQFLHPQVRYTSSEVYEQSNSPDTLTHKRNSGRKKFKETRHPIYRGVREKSNGKWVCEMRLPKSNCKTRIWLGTHNTPEMAARAYDVAALALKGDSAELNFPDSAWLLKRAKSCLTSDIQSAAKETAEAFRPTSQASPNSSSLPVNSTAAENVEEDFQMFLDEEAMFNMPDLLTNMAEGMLLAPPAMQREFSWDSADYNMDLSLWSD